MHQARGSTRRTALIILAAMLPVASALAQEAISGNSADPLASVVQSMEKAQSEIQLPHRITREYRFGSTSSMNAAPDIIAEVDFTPPGTYSIQKRSGSGRAEQVVRRVLEHEIQISVSTQKSQSTAVTRDNYNFSYLGKTLLNGRPCYLLQVTPKRKQTELISGRAWIDQQSFLIVRMEGDLAKSPSWWVKSVHVDLGFSSSRDTWVQTSMEAVAQVRCLGPQKLTSRVLDYQTAPVAAKNVYGLRTSSAAGSR